MHIYEGVLTGTTQGQLVLAAGTALAALGTAVGLARLDVERIPRVAVLTSAFFIVSSLPIPIGTVNVHLVLGGLMGLILGWSAFPAVLVALALQTVLLPCVGPTVLGVNTLIMALPAVLCRGLFHRAACSSNERLVLVAGFAAGAVAVLLGAMINGGCLFLAGQSFELLGKASPLLHMPIALVEGLVTASVVVMIRKVRPELLDAQPLVPAAEGMLHD